MECRIELMGYNLMPAVLCLMKINVSEHLIGPSFRAPSSIILFRPFRQHKLFQIISLSPCKMAKGWKYFVWRAMQRYSQHGIRRHLSFWAIQENGKGRCAHYIHFYAHGDVPSLKNLSSCVIAVFPTPKRISGSQLPLLLMTE